MLPPIEDSVLQSNPKFASLHEILKNSILTSNGATKRHAAQKERDAVIESLKVERLHASKRHILQTSLKEVDVSPPKERDSKKSSNTLPAELLDLILLLSARVSDSAFPSSVKLLESTTQWASLNTHLPAIGSLFSTHLHNQALALVRIQSPTTNASYLHRGILKLVPNTIALKDDVGAQKRDLENRRLVLVSKTTTLLSIYHLAITLIIRILEQTKHGSVARHVKTKAEYLSLSARQAELEVREKAARAERLVYTRDVVDALQNYMRNLKDGQDRLKERERDARRVLWGYGVGRVEGGGEEKEKIMKEIGRVYGSLIREVREVGRDVEKLKAS